MNRRYGGLIGNAPDFLIFVIHAIIGHPTNAVKPNALYSYTCVECGQYGLGKPDDK